MGRILEEILVPIIILLVMSAVVPVLAQGFFDKTCDRCDGKGWIVCPKCDGSGELTCSKCEGKGYYYEEQTCSRCGGSGKATPDIRITDSEGKWIWLTTLRVTVWVKNYENTRVEFTLRVQLLDNNQNVKESMSRDCYVSAKDTVKQEFDFNNPSASNYYRYEITSVEKITCPDCGGTGKITTKVTCEVCSGDGRVTCTNCGGDGRVTCPSCSGRGYVTDYVKVGGVAFGGLIALGIVAFALKSMGGKPLTVQPRVPPPPAEVSFEPSPKLEPPTVSKEVADLVEERQKYQKLIGDLKERVSSEAVSEKTFQELRDEYQEKLSDIKKQIGKIKKQLRTEMRSLENRKQILSEELEKLETRLKLGEINNDQFEEKSSGLKAELGNIDAELKAKENDLKIL